MTTSLIRIPQEIIENSIRYLDVGIKEKNKVLIFYHSDADGLMSLWILTKVCKHLGATDVRSVPVWNHDFSFEFLKSTHTDEFVIFTDLPVLQEHALLADFSENTISFVYDHHHPPKDLPVLIPNVQYQNSLIFHDKSYPASYFAHSLYFSLLGSSDICNLLTSIGLIGDNALNDFPEIKDLSQKRYPGLFNGESILRSQAGRLCSSFNVLYKAKPRGLEIDLCKLLPINEIDPMSELYEIRKTLGTEELSKAITNEVAFYCKKYITQMTNAKHGSRLVDLTDMSTFSVGIVAANLISDGSYIFVALGFNLGDRIQYELRMKDTKKFTVLDVLDKIKTNYKPISCGGHKNAGGLLIKSCDKEIIEQLLIAASYLSEG